MHRNVNTFRDVLTGQYGVMDDNLAVEIDNITTNAQTLAGKVIRVKTHMTEGPGKDLTDAIRSSHITEKANNPDATSAPKEPSPRYNFKTSRVADLQRVMRVEINKIKTEDIRGDDMSTDYLVLFAFVVIALIGGFIFYQISQANRSLPLTSKNRVD